MIILIGTALLRTLGQPTPHSVQRTVYRPRHWLVPTLWARVSVTARFVPVNTLCAARDMPCVGVPLRNRIGTT